MKYKRCKNCGAINEINEPFCNECMEASFEIANDYSHHMIHSESSSDIKSINSINSIKSINSINRTSTDRNNQTILDSKRSLKLINSDFKISIEDSIILGREHYGSLYLNRYPTVSRKHLKVIYRDSSWFIKDLNSTNGTYLNGERIEANREYEISSVDMLKLSSKVEFKVEI